MYLFILFMLYIHTYFLLHYCISISLLISPYFPLILLVGSKRMCKFLLRRNANLNKQNLNGNNICYVICIYY